MKYLLCEAHGIGDCILILPIAKAIKMADKNAYIKVFTSSDKNKILINKSIMDLQNYVDDIEYYSKTEKWHSLIFLFSNILKRYDYGIVIQDYDTESTSSIPSLIVRLCCAKTCGTMITKNRKIKYDCYVNREVGIRRDEYFLRAARSLNLKVERVNDNLLNPKLVKKYLPTISINNKFPVIALVVGTAPVSLRTSEGMLTNNAKAWPYEKWIELADMLASNDCNVLLLGGQKEKKELLSLKLLKKNTLIYELVGELNIKESIAILGISSLVVGADTGLMHCAGALGKKSLTLFGCTDPNEYLPFGKDSQYIDVGMKCSPCFGTIAAVTCKHKSCMESITVEMVFNRIMSILGKV